MALMSLVTNLVAFREKNITQSICGLRFKFKMRPLRAGASFLGEKRLRQVNNDWSAVDVDVAACRCETSAAVDSTCSAAIAGVFFLPHTNVVRTTKSERIKLAQNH